MKEWILSIDTSMDHCVLALSNGNDLIAEVTEPSKWDQTKKMLGLIDGLLSKANIPLSDIGAFATTIGPGSFTGLRTSLATAKGFCFALEKPLIGIPTFETMIEPIQDHDHVVPVIEAKRDAFYVATYSRKNDHWIEEKKAQMILKVELRAYIGTAIALGTAARKYHSTEPGFSLVDSKFDTICAKNLASLAWKKFVAKDFSETASVEPLYIQKTAAEGYV